MLVLAMILLMKLVVQSTLQQLLMHTNDLVAAGDSGGATDLNGDLDDA
jgi:hypothetical protein